MARIAIDARKLRDYGVGTYIVELLSGLEGLPGDERYVVFLSPGDELPFVSARFETVTTRARKYGLSEHVALPWMAGRRHASLFHAPHYVLPWLARHPSVVTIHDVIHLRFREHLPFRGAYLYAQAVMGHAYRSATRVLTVSESTKRDLLAAFGGREERVVVVPNAIDPLFLAPPEPGELEAARERLELPARYVLYAGNVKPHKNLPHLVRAFARLVARAGHDDVKLVLAGSRATSHGEIRALAAELGVLDRLRFTGFVTTREIRAVYHLASVFVFPSLYEGFGLPPLEAMACGVPVIASDAASLPEVLGEAALLVPPTDLEALVERMAAVLQDDRLRKDLIVAGHARAERYRRSPAAATLDVYRKALKEAA